VGADDVHEETANDCWEVAHNLLAELLNHKVRGLLSDEHFSVDGTQFWRGPQ
jgi:hypothetical protein